MKLTTLLVAAVLLVTTTFASADSICQKEFNDLIQCRRAGRDCRNEEYAYKKCI
ncbi:hypothetical protein HDV05_002781, partial [Chytridiales sp. JEL 0842]